jgi:hypothetical protein
MDQIAADKMYEIPGSYYEVITISNNCPVYPRSGEEV